MFGLNCFLAESHKPNLFYISLPMFNYEFLLQHCSLIHCSLPLAWMLERESLECKIKVECIAIIYVSIQC